MSVDMVNFPPHYLGHPSKVECIDFTENMPFCLGNAWKYLFRASEKGTPMMDLKKAHWYIKREMQRYVAMSHAHRLPAEPHISTAQLGKVRRFFTFEEGTRKAVFQNLWCAYVGGGSYGDKGPSHYLAEAERKLGELYTETLTGIREHRTETEEGKLPDNYVKREYKTRASKATEGESHPKTEKKNASKPAKKKVAKKVPSHASKKMAGKEKASR